MKLCKEAMKAIEEGVKRNDAVQILSELGYHATSIANLERHGIFYIEHIFQKTNNFLLINVFHGQYYRLYQLKYILNRYHKIKKLPPDTIDLDISGYDKENFEKSHIAAKARFEKRELFNGSYKYRP